MWHGAEKIYDKAQREANKKANLEAARNIAAMNAKISKPTQPVAAAK